MSATACQIVEAIREAFDQLCFRYTASDRTRRVWVPWRNKKGPLTGRDGWTRAINTALCRVGQEFHFQARVKKGKYDPAEGVQPDGGELLWDITWLQRGQGKINAAPVVAESELGQTVAAIAEDFQKLLLADANVRLMIIEHFTDWDGIDGAPAEGQHRAPAMANHLAQHVQAFCHGRPDVVYLLVSLDGYEKPYANHRIRYFRLKTDGTAVEWVRGKPSPFCE